MLGIGEVLVIGVAFLLVGGGGAGAFVAGLRRQAVQRARELVEEEVRRAVPAEVKEAARTLQRVVEPDPVDDDERDRER